MNKSPSVKELELKIASLKLELRETEQALEKALSEYPVGTVLVYPHATVVRLEQLHPNSVRRGHILDDEKFASHNSKPVYSYMYNDGSGKLYWTLAALHEDRGTNYIVAYNPEIA